jgi:hypothetical protein
MRWSSTAGLLTWFTKLKNNSVVCGGNFNMLKI